MGPIRRLMAEQSGVVSRRQVLAHGGDDLLVERLLRRREWARVHPGVYVEHTGETSHRQRSWAAVLHAWPAALSGWSALHAHAVREAGTRAAPDPVEVAIDRDRRVVAPPGVEVRRLVGLDRRTQWHRSPPRLRLEDAVLQVAGRLSDDEAVALLADVCQERRTTPDRLLATLDEWPRLPGRCRLPAILSDVRVGVRSLLEQRYLHEVEQAHGLPVGRRQSTFVAEGRTGYRDVLYDDQGVVVELDGRLGHDLTAERGRDLDRDLLSAVTGLVTVRVGWAQVTAPCLLARRLGDLLAVRGWCGQVRPCSPACASFTG